MGIYDRDYVFGNQRPRVLSVTAWIIIINVSIFVGDWLLGHVAGITIPVQRSELSNVQGIKLSDLPGKLVMPSDYFILVGSQEVNGKPQDTYAPAPKEVMKLPGRAVHRLVSTSDGQFVGSITYITSTPLEALGHFSTFQAIQRLEVWRLVTFQFLHAGLLHLGFNMLGLWVFGRFVEEQLGRSRYLAFYLITGICGALMYLTLNALGLLASKLGLGGIPGLLIQDVRIPLVGASAGVFGVIMACAYVAPNTIVQLLLPPIPMKMRTFAYTYVAIAFLMVLFGAKNAGGEAAHIGGAIAGFFFIRRPHLLRDFFAEFRDLGKYFRKKPIKPNLKLVGRDVPPADPLGPELRAELDRILDKSHREGPQSLTNIEQATLRDATEKLNRART
jgi:membrane associated rhomboid family serine protease